MVKKILFLYFFLSGLIFSQQIIEEANLKILGSALFVSPENQTVPLETNTVVKTFLGTENQRIEADPSYKVVGELTGPQFSIPITLSTFPNEDFQIPGFSLPGEYFLENIRLEKDGRFVMYSQPSKVSFLAKQILVTKVETRPLTLEEIQARGIIIDSTSFNVIELTVGFKLESDTYEVSFPIVFTEEGPQIIPDTGGCCGVGGGGPGIDLPQIAPFQLELDELELPEGVEEEEIPEKISIPGLIIIPTDIAFLHQFFSVLLIAKNDAPEGDVLKIKDLFAKIYLPKGLREAKTNPPVPLGTFIPVKDPGPDGILGNGDDLTIIVAQAEGKAEWNVEGLEEGNHIVNIEMYGTLEGLPVGPIPIKSKTKGMVIVRDPTFAFNVSHPAVVRKDEYYDMYLTITNTSNTPANLVTVSFNPNNIIGSIITDIVGPEGSEKLDDYTLRINTIPAHTSSSIKIKMFSTQTGKVTATALNVSSSSSSAKITLTVGVGEKGIPLSPTSLIFPPFISVLPYEISRYGIDLLGLGYSLATAPPGAVPPDMPILSKSIIQRRGWELSLSARYIEMGLEHFHSISNLTLNWLGNTVFDPAFDNLRRKTEKGKKFAEEVEKVLKDHLEKPENSFSDFLADFFYFNCDRDPYILILLKGSDKAKLGIYNYESNKLTIDDYSQYYQRDVQSTEIFKLEKNNQYAQLGIIGFPYYLGENKQKFPSHYQIQIFGRDGHSGETVSLKILKGKSDGSFSILDYGEITVYPTPAPSAILELNIENTNPIFRFKNGIIQQEEPSESNLNCPPFSLELAVQDMTADPIGRAVTLIFNQKIKDIENKEEFLKKFDLTAYIQKQGVPINTIKREVFAYNLQEDGKTLILLFKNPLSPFSSNNLSINGLESLNGQTLSTTREIEMRMPPHQGAIVTGQVIGPDGNPVPNAPVELLEEDEDSIGGTPFPHITAVSRTDLNGYYIFDFVRSHSPCNIKAYDPSTGDYGEINYKTTPDALHWINIVMLAKGNIKGKVIYSDGTIPQYANVMAFSGVFGENKEVRVNPETGEYFISMMPVGNVSLTAKDNYGRITYSNVYISYAGQIVEKDMVIQKREGIGLGSIKGYVYFSNGEPVSGTYVGLYDNYNPIAFDKTKEDGSFGFSNVPEGVYPLRAYDPRTNKIGGSAYVEVLKDSVASVNIIILDLFGTLSGYVKRIDENYQEVPVKDAIVYLYGTQFITTTNDIGFYQITNIPYGNYLVEAVSLAYNEKDSKYITINESNTNANLDFLLSKPKGKIVGVVKDENGQVAAGATVSIVVAGYAVKKTTTSSDGSFIFEDLPVGTYTLHAVKSGVQAGIGMAKINYPGEQANITISFFGSRDVKIITYQRAEGGNINKVGVPIKYRHLIVNEYKVIEFMDEYESGTTLPDGEAIIENVLCGNFVITAGDPVFGQKTESFQVEKGDGYQVFEIIIDSLCKIKGTVYDYDGTPKGGAEVYIENSQYSVRTNDDGNYEISGIKNGSYSIVAKYENGAQRMARTAAKLTYGGQVMEGVDLKLPKLGNVKVYVYDDGAKVNGAEVRLQEMVFPGRSFSSQTTGDDLYAYFPNITEGKFSVTATYLKGTHTISGRANGIIDEEGETVEVNVYLSGYGNIYGKVLSPENVPV